MTMFKNLVYNTALSGLEAEEPNEKELKELDKVVVRLMRRVIGEEGVIVKAEAKRGKCRMKQ